MAKRKYTLDYVIKSSPTILFNFISTPSGLALWFADHVDNTERAFSFFWGGYEEKAVLLEKEENVFVKFKMEDSEDGVFFEFRIERSPVTGDTIMLVTDFSEEDEWDDQKILWDQQIKSLISRVGASN